MSVKVSVISSLLFVPLSGVTFPGAPIPRGMSSGVWGLLRKWGSAERHSDEQFRGYVQRSRARSGALPVFRGERRQDGNAAVEGLRDDSTGG